MKKYILPSLALFIILGVASYAHAFSFKDLFLFGDISGADRDREASHSPTLRPSRSPEPSHSPRPSQTPSSLPSTAVTCIKNAIQTRDNSLSNAIDQFSTAIKNAISARKSAIFAAWGLTDPAARRTAIQNANQAYRTAVGNANTALKNARNSIWNTYESDIRACKPQTGGPFNSNDNWSATHGGAKD